MPIQSTSQSVAGFLHPSASFVMTKRNGDRVSANVDDRRPYEFVACDLNASCRLSQIALLSFFPARPMDTTFAGVDAVSRGKLARMVSAT